MVMESGINLDKNASYGVHPAVLEGLKGIDLPSICNPSSIHQGGQGARYLIEEARADIAQLVGAAPGDKVVFTSGATEANNQVILGAALRKGAHIVTTAIEHPALLEAAREAERRGAKLTVVPVPRSGVVEVNALKAAITDNTTLVSLMFANNEVGTLQPVSEIGEHLRQIGSMALYHSDAVQALGKSELNFASSKLDFASISAHKIGALAGIGALIVRSGIEIQPLIFGGPQEKRARAGTENILGIVSFGLAARLFNEEKSRRIATLQKNREVIWSILRDSTPSISPTVDLKDTIPNTLSLKIDGINSADLVVALDLEGVWVSSGAACASGKPGASYVLTSIGLTEDEARSVIRISVGAEDTEESLKLAAQKISKVISRMRSGK
jgi:cysteine desulfurase